MHSSIVKGTETLLGTYIGTRVATSALHEGVSKSFRTGRLERELQMVQLSATRCSWIAICESF
jgi:hypothetical protein